MAKTSFTTTDLDKLIDESVEEVDQIKNELQGINPSDVSYDEDQDEDEFLPNDDKTFLQKGDVLDKASGDKISYSYVYKKIGDLIDIGNAQLQVLQSIDPDVTDPALLNSATSLINAIRSCIAEFTKIHQQWIRYQQVVSLEKMKFANKIELAKFRNELRSNNENKVQEAQPMMELGSNELVEFLMWKKEKEANSKKEDI